MNNKLNKKLRSLANQTAAKVRKSRRIEGWHEDESQFPKCDFDIVVEMLETAYRLGRESTES